MANKGLQAFDDFTAGVLGKLSDADARARAESAIAVLKGVAPVAQAFGDGIAGQAEIDRQLQDLRAKTEDLTTRQTELDDKDARLSTWHDSLSTWYQDNAALVEEAKRLKANGGERKPAGAPAAIPEGVLTEAAYKDAIAQERAGFLGYQRDQNLITREHFTRFKEIVDVEPLLRHPQIATLGLVGVYELVHKDRLDKWKTDTTKAAEQKIADEAVRTYQASQASMPYPSPTGVGSGSPLDGLAVGKQDSVVDAATQEYQRLISERVGAPAR